MHDSAFKQYEAGDAESITFPASLKCGHLQKAKVRHLPVEMGGIVNDQDSLLA